MKTDLSIPVRDVNSAPMISAEAYAAVGKYAGALVLSCFEQMGGLPRMVVWADQNPTDFYTKLMPKVIQRSTAVEHSGSVTIDDAISRLEDADYREVYDL